MALPGHRNRNMKTTVTKRITVLLLTFAFCLTLFTGCSESGDGSAYKIAVVPKLTAASWFERMESGVKNYNEVHGTDYFYGGPTDTADQAAYLEQLLAEDWDAICVVPFDSESLSPILEKAKREGILIITHEAASMDPRYFDYDVEAFEAIDFGENFAKEMIEMTGGEGTYIQFVGSLNSVSHIEWCDSADRYIQANSDLQKLGRYETGDDLTSSYNQTKELLQAHPEITAIQGCASTDLVGAARAIEELGLAGKVALVGTSVASLCKEYISDGTMSTFSLWDSGEAAKAMLALAEKVLDEGDAFDPAACSLSIPGYENMTYRDGVFFGSARVDVDAGNIADYDF